MKNFTYSIPTIVHFGEGQITHLGELKQSGERSRIHGFNWCGKGWIYAAGIR